MRFIWWYTITFAVIDVSCIAFIWAMVRRKDKEVALLQAQLDEEILRLASIQYDHITAEDKKKMN